MMMRAWALMGAWAAIGMNAFGTVNYYTLHNGQSIASLNTQICAALK